jgi:DNA-binding winged helix-turn-helix (wHTH) protein
MSGTNAGSTRFCFREFSLDLARGEFRRGATCVKLRPKPFKVLVHLVENVGRLVTKDELLDAVWGRVVVSEGALSQCIVDIRKALGPDARQLLRTVPRKGFILDAEIRIDREPVEANDARGNVLPFTHHSVRERGAAYRLARRVAMAGIVVVLGSVSFVRTPGIGDVTASSSTVAAGSASAAATDVPRQAPRVFRAGPVSLPSTLHR